MLFLMKTKELAEKLKVFSEKVKIFLKSIWKYVKTRKVTRWNVLTIIALLISVLASFPILSKFYIYYSYAPPLDITIGSFNTTIPWSQIYGPNGSIAGIAIINKDVDRDMTVQMEIKVNDTVQLRPNMQNYFETVPTRNGFMFRLITSLYLPANGGGGPTFPFEPLDASLKIDITVYPTMKMSEFGLPTFFGDVELQSFTKEFIVVP